MIRVGFVNIFAVREWLGGLNYLRNLLQAVCGLEGRRIEPVLFTGTGTDVAISAEFSFMSVVCTRALDRGHALWALRRLLQRVLGLDLVLARVLSAANIQVLSHSGDLGRAARIPSIAWVADLQHRYLKHLFSAEQTALRDKQIAQALVSCTRMIVSSETAAQDLRSHSPAHAGKIRVLRFASGLMHGGVLPERAELLARYRIEGPYIHLPNQFWAHKNHEVVIEALRQLKDAGQPVVVVATGLMDDPRQPRHVDALMKRARGYGLEEMFRPLGVVPYAHMLGLMRDAVAVMNPSLFEGWSTSVEEAKSMGKAIILSDIPVHREQAPERGFFFDPRNAADAANAIRTAWSAFDAVADEAAAVKASSELPRRMREFAEAYQRIVLEALESGHA